MNRSNKINFESFIIESDKIMCAYDNINLFYGIGNNIIEYNKVFTELKGKLITPSNIDIIYNYMRQSTTYIIKNIVHSNLWYETKINQTIKSIHLFDNNIAIDFLYTTIIFVFDDDDRMTQFIDTFIQQSLFVLNKKSAIRLCDNYHVYHWNNTLIKVNTLSCPKRFEKMIQGSYNIFLELPSSNDNNYLEFGKMLRKSHVHTLNICTFHNRDSIGGAYHEERDVINEILYDNYTPASKWEWEWDFDENQPIDIFKNDNVDQSNKSTNVNFAELGRGARRVTQVQQGNTINNTIIKLTIDIFSDFIEHFDLSNIFVEDLTISKHNIGKYCDEIIEKCLTHPTIKKIRLQLCYDSIQFSNIFLKLPNNFKLYVYGGLKININELTQLCEYICDHNIKLVTQLKLATDSYIKTKIIQLFYKYINCANVLHILKRPLEVLDVKEKNIYDQIKKRNRKLYKMLIK